MTPAKPGGPLAGLDSRALPVVARLLRGAGRAGRAVAGPDGALGRRIGPWVRRDPVIAVALACVAFAAILISVTGGDDKGAVRPPGHAGPRLSSAHLLGPTTGSTVASYQAQASQRRGSLDQLAASQPLVAVVDLAAYVTPEAVDQLLAGTPGLAVVRGFARVPPPLDADVHVLLPSNQTDLAAGLSAAQQDAAQIALRYERELSRSITNPSTKLSEKVAAGAAQAAAARVDASGLGPSCGCVFAVVVMGPVGQLEQLAHQDAVRILDPAPVSATLSSLMIVPVEPQVTDTVPALSFAGE
ncbi:MAG TPA: hypothetical protein VG650_10065 [Mycobacteriales bacterium]|nr:hypothetical protein [Mycobacteriales bacterium]